MRVYQILWGLLALVPAGVLALDAETLQKDWRWIREDAEEWKLSDDGALRIRTQPGRIWAEREEKAENILVRRAPVADQDSIEIAVKLVDPMIKYEQAGVVLYVDDDRFVKFVVEYIDGDYFVVMGREFAGEKRLVLAKVKIEGQGSQLRLEVEGDKVKGSWKSADGNSEGWTPATEASIPAELTRSFAVFTQDGPADEVRWAEIDLQAKR